MPAFEVKYTLTNGRTYTLEVDEAGLQEIWQALSQGQHLIFNPPKGLKAFAPFHAIVHVEAKTLRPS